MALLSGCAVFKADKIGQVSDQDLRSTAPVKTKVHSTWSAISPTGARLPESDVAGKASMDASKKHFEAALKASDCCIAVATAGEADLVVEGSTHLEDHSGAGIAAALTGFTFGAIPSWATMNLHITATAKAGGQTRSYDVQDGMTMVMWLPMLLVMPFTGNAIAEGDKVTQNVYNTLVVKIKSDGLIR